MLDLQKPIGSYLDDSHENVSIERVWKRLEASPEVAAIDKKSTGVWMWTGALTATFALAAMLFVALGGKPFGMSLDGVFPGGTDGKLLSTSGKEVELLSSEEDDQRDEEQLSRIWDFQDGSSIELSRASELRVLANTNKNFVTHLRKGRAMFRVKPKGSRRWTVEAGILSVEVIGTQFSVDRKREFVEVKVRKGQVLVRPQGSHQKIRKLLAGQSIRVARNEIEAIKENRKMLAKTGIQIQNETESPGEVAEARESGQKEANGEREEAPVEKLFRKVDLARKRGAYGKAASLLREVSKGSYPRGDRSVGTFMLGKMELEQLGRPARAARSFGKALRLGLPQALREDAYARRVEAYVRSQNRGAAEHAAAEYGRYYPNGRYQHQVRKWLAVVAQQY